MHVPSCYLKRKLDGRKNNVINVFILIRHQPLDSSVRLYNIVIMGFFFFLIFPREYTISLVKNVLFITQEKR